MKVRKRGVDIKRHTTSYLVGNRWISRAKATSLAKEGKVDGVTVVNGKYIQSKRDHTNLYDLPVTLRS